MRRFPFAPAVFRADQVEEENVFRGMKYKDMPVYPFAVAGVGCAFCYIRYSAIEKILYNYEYPFNNWQMKNGDALGEDLSFMHRCNLLGLKIGCVPDVDVGHITERSVSAKDHLWALEEIERQQNEN